ncbi:hypothetical protein D3C75_1115460 [compost metagenome]
MAGALPPSSRLTLMMFSAAASITFCPAGTLPVRLTIPTFGLLASSLPTSAPLPVTRLNTPLGSPAASTILLKATALFGDSALGLTTIVFPVIRAGAIFLAIRKNGKFQGRMPVVTPIARLNTKMFSLSRSLCTISPS